MNQQNKTEKPGRSRALTAAALLCFSAAATLYVSSNSPSMSDIISTGRSLSIAHANGGCEVTYAHVSEVDIVPAWQASFPGSGSRMTWSLVEALTGIRTTDDFDSHDRGYTRTVAVKTHYPIKNAKHKFGALDELDFGRAMVILRNPINAIPSYFNLQYEHLNHLPNHSTRGPNEEWIKYRDHPGYDVSDQLLRYEEFVQYWMEKYPDRQKLLLASYEDLTDDYIGPVVAMRIANFLGEIEGVEPIATESVPCVWQTIVNYKNLAPPAEDLLPGDEVDVSRRKKKRDLGVKTHADPSSLRTGPKVRPYTEDNLADMLAMFQRLTERYHFDEEFVRIMASYIETVSNTEPNLWAE